MCALVGSKGRHSPVASPGLALRVAQRLVAHSTWDVYTPRFYFHKLGRKGSLKSITHPRRCRSDLNWVFAAHGQPANDDVGHRVRCQ